MDILNKKERFSAFMLFLLMFVVTTGVLITALFYNFGLPLKENEVLRSENEKMVQRNEYQHKFSDEYSKITTLIDSMKKAPERIPYIETSISSKLDALDKEIPDDTLSSILYKRIILNTQDLITTKKNMAQYSDSRDKIEKLSEENKNLQKQVDKAYLDIQIANSRASN